MTKHYEFKSSPFDRLRKLVINQDYIEFEDGNLVGEEFTRMDKENIADFKYGMEWIVWYEFTVGRLFSISLKDKQSKEVRISFRSFFGLRKEYAQIYSNIVSDIWDYYQLNIIGTYLERFYNNEDLILQGLQININGVQLRSQNTTLPWTNVEIKEYSNYFAIFDKLNPASHSRISFNEYQSQILWSAIKTILKDKDLTAAK